MFGSETLEVAIGLVFMFFILSLMMTSAREIIEGWLQTRAIHLERGVRELLKDQSGGGLARQLYDHPLISSLFRGDYDPQKLTGRWLKRNDSWKRVPFRSNLPAYIPARNFAAALLDLAARGSPGQGSEATLTLDQIREGVAVRIPDPHVRRAVLLAIDDARGDLERARANVEAWFDSGMDRVSGWYRKETQVVLLTLGLLLAWGFNIDSLRVARTLLENDARRTVIVTQAAAFIDRVKTAGSSAGDQTAMLRQLGCRPETPPPPTESTAPAEKGEAPAKSEPTNAATQSRADLSCAERKIKDLGYPVGWEGKKILWSWLNPWSYDGTWTEWWRVSQFPWGSIPGWIITALAVSLGAPFWFDLLNKMMVIRSTVKPHEKSPEEASEDRQSKKDGNGARDPGGGNTPSPPPPPPPPPPAPPPAARDPLFQPRSWTGSNPQEGDL
jgi:hypothetical protein